MPLRAAKLAIRMEAFIAAATAETQAAMQADLDNLLASGVSREVLLQYLERSAPEYKQALVNKVMHPLRAAINQATVASYWSRISGVSNYWRWVWEPTAKHCTTCTERNGLVGTRAQFEAIGIPGAGTTICQGGCRCTLVPITKEEFDQSDRRVA